MYIDITYKDIIYHFIFYRKVNIPPKVQAKDADKPDEFQTISWDGVPDEVIEDLKFYCTFVVRYDFPRE